MAEVVQSRYSRNIDICLNGLYDIQHFLAEAGLNDLPEGVLEAWGKLYEYFIVLRSSRIKEE